jgi:hypothetical protein
MNVRQHLSLFETRPSTKSQFDESESYRTSKYIIEQQELANQNGQSGFSADNAYQPSTTLAPTTSMSHGRQTPNPESLPPKVPTKPKIISEMFRNMHPQKLFSQIQQPSGKEEPDFHSEAQHSIILLDNEGSEAGSPPTSAIQESPETQVSFASDRPNPMETLWGNIQKQTKSIDIGQVFSDTFNPLLTTAKDHAEKTTEATKPAMAAMGRGIMNIPSNVKAAVGKVEVPEAFQKTQDDVADLTARMTALYNSDTGICSKCRQLPVDLLISNSPTSKEERKLDWSSPLSRIIYHAEWCKVCSLLLTMLCEPQNDPLQHVSVSSHVQPELAGLTMKEWVSNGWKYTDENWPFGQGQKRHEGASHVLGPAGDKLGVVLQRVMRLSLTVAARTQTGRRPADTTRLTRDFNHRERLRLAKNPPQYPLSCLVTISTLDTPYSGMLQVGLVGYGRKLGADLEMLSQFRLRAVSRVPMKTTALQAFNSDGAFSYGRMLHPNWIDPSIGRLWLSECEGNHGTACSQQGWDLAMRKPRSLRVIDVENLCIKEVMTTDSIRYVALSYVWGNATMVKLLRHNQRDLMVKHSLLGILPSLPRTISGAIEVVKAIGERYLWNDALCILQDDKNEVKDQIDSMDAVYGGAVATIICAGGSDSNSGLEGIRLSHWRNVAQSVQYHQPTVFPDKPRVPGALSGYKTAAITDEISIVAPLRTTDHNLSGSIWNSRAWTFQERVLSRRLIIFSHGHMIWQCRCMVCREDMTVADSGVDYNSLQWLSIDPRAGDNSRQGVFLDDSTERTRHGTTRLVRSTRFAEYAKAVEEYTHRQMSNSADILNAFAGLGRIFSIALQSEAIFGLPAKNLDAGLHWRPTRQLVRRTGFPSWSWAGWIGQVTFNRPYKLVRGANGGFVSYAEDTHGEEGIRPLIRWHVLGSSHSDDLLEMADGNNFVSPVNGNGLGFPYDSDVPPKEWENGPWHTEIGTSIGEPRSAPPIPANVFSHRAPGDVKQQLIMWASCTSNLHIGERIVQQSDQVWTRTNAPLRHWIEDSESYAVGNVLLDAGDNKAWLDHKRFGFVQIAEAQYSGLDDEERDVEDFSLYVVMLVEWDEQRQVAERRGLGRMSKEAWKLAMPKMKLVRLQ